MGAGSLSYVTLYLIFLRKVLVSVSYETKSLGIKKKGNKSLLRCLVSSGLGINLPYACPAHYFYLSLLSDHFL